MNQAPLTLLIDGKCPLCSRESAFLMRRDKGRGRLRVVDIAASDFDPAPYGRSFEELMGRIHAVAADGSIITGMEVFRRAYKAIGLGWLLAPTGWPIIRPVADAAYRWFARNRHRLGRRNSCADGTCGVSYSDSPSATR
ncbi:MAG: DUF393 domain-containing protein [Phycisphaerales bacterium]|nr:DUF393 domain-containing protein [Phycisphaerales bacterium]